MRNIPAKNYTVLFIIIVVTITVFGVLFTNYSRNQEKTTKMYELLSEIKENDLIDYLKEKDRVLIYVADKYDLSFSKMEHKLISGIKEHSLVETFVYLDVSNLDNSFFKKIVDKYDYEINFKNIPLIIIFVDNKIENVIYVDNNFELENIINIEDIK